MIIKVKENSIIFRSDWRLLLLAFLFASVLAIIGILLMLLILVGIENISIPMKVLLWVALVCMACIPLMFLYLAILSLYRFVEISKLEDGRINIKTASNKHYAMTKIDKITIETVWLLRPGYNQYLATVVSDNQKIPFAMSIFRKSVNKSAEALANYLNTHIESSSNTLTPFHLFDRYR